MHKFFLASSVFLTILIFVGSLVEYGKPVQQVFDLSDKIIHASAYALLTISWLLAFKRSTKKQLINFQISIAILTYGIIIEVLQGVATTYRTAEISDVFANLFGIVIGNLFFHFLFSKK